MNPITVMALSGALGVWAAYLGGYIGLIIFGVGIAWGVTIMLWTQYGKEKFKK